MIDHISSRLAYIFGIFWIIIFKRLTCKCSENLGIDFLMLVTHFAWTFVVVPLYMNENLFEKYNYLIRDLMIPWINSVYIYEIFHDVPITICMHHILVIAIHYLLTQSQIYYSTEAIYLFGTSYIGFVNCVLFDLYKMYRTYTKDYDTVDNTANNTVDNTVHDIILIVVKVCYILIRTFTIYMYYAELYRKFSNSSNSSDFTNMDSIMYLVYAMFSILHLYELSVICRYSNDIYEFMYIYCH